jgi:uncharacterized protein (TIGR02145 family)
MGIRIGIGKIVIGQGSPSQYWTQQKIATILNRNNPIGYFNAFNQSTITKDGSNVVSEWRDQLGSAHKFNAGGCTWDATKGMTFTAALSQYLAMTFGAVTSPFYVFIAVKEKAFTSADVFKAGAFELAQGVAHNLYLSTAQTIYTVDAIQDKTQILRCFLNGESSKLAIDSQVGPITLLNNQTISSFYLAHGTAAFCNMEVTDLIVLTSLTPADEVLIYEYLRWKNTINGKIYDVSVQQAAYTALKFGALIEYGMFCFVNDQWYPSTNYLSPNTFNPTDLDIDEWLDAFVSAGMSFATLDCCDIDGFCLWPTKSKPTGYDSHSIEKSSWYAANGSPDIVKLFVDGCRARGLEPHLYWSPYQYVWKYRTGEDPVTTISANYITYLKTQLSELLSNYGDIKLLWIDTWGWKVLDLNTSGLPFWILQDYIKSLQPGCILLNNDHAIPSVRSEVEVHEVNIDALVPVGNIRIAEQVQSPRKDLKWAFDTSLTENTADYMTAGDVNIARVLANSKNAVYHLGSSPNNTGHLSTAQLALLTLIGATPQPVSASVEDAAKTQVVIKFNKVLDTPTPATSAFALAGKTISTVAVSSNTVTLTVSVAYAYGDSIAVSYTKPGSNKLIDILKGDEVASFSNFAVTNNIILASIVDGDGNIYTEVTVGTQVWLNRNLITTKYNDGSAINRINCAAGGGAAAWAADTAGAFDYPYSDASFKPYTGCLYNGYNLTKLCPVGYHIPTVAEWATLIAYAGGATVAGGKLKSVASGTNYWGSPNVGATDDYGFAATWSGYINGSNGMYNDGAASGVLAKSNWGYNYIQANSATLIVNDIGPNGPHMGWAIRCIKD